jgi:glycosyltransferase involved in cell wall biosynthesis
MLDLITPIILTYNEAANIGARLRELNWASDIVVVDSFSGDDTVKIISAFPQARLFQRTFDNHASQWNFALKETGVQTDWVLALDADYRLPAEFADELNRLSGNDGTAGYCARFVYCIHGRAISSGVYPPVVVLYQRSRAQYIQDGHTQRLDLKGKVETLQTRLYHDDRKSLAAFLKAQSNYARLEASKILSASPQSLGLADRVRRLRICAPLAILLYCLIYRGGLFDGWAGFYYAFQRVAAETLLSLYLIEHDLKIRSNAKRSSDADVRSTAAVAEKQPGATT